MIAMIPIRMNTGATSQVCSIMVISVGRRVTASTRL